MSILCGIHPVAEALRSGHPLERLLVAQGAGGSRLQELIDLASQALQFLDEGSIQQRLAMQATLARHGRPGR